jgi:hypothetical protein
MSLSAIITSRGHRGHREQREDNEWRFERTGRKLRWSGSEPSVISFSSVTSVFSVVNALLVKLSPRFITTEDRGDTENREKTIKGGALKGPGASCGGAEAGLLLFPFAL